MKMGKYWKIDMLRKLIKIEETKKENVTITMDYLTYLKEKLSLLEEAFKQKE